MSTEKKLSQMMMELVNEKTFSLEGVKAIEAMRGRVETLELRLEDNAKENDRLRVDLNKFRENDMRVADYERKLNDRADKITKREVEMTDAEKRVAVAEAKSSIYGDIIGRVFANRQIRESVVGESMMTGAGPNTSSYPTQVPPKSTTRTEE